MKKTLIYFIIIFSFLMQNKLFSQYQIQWVTDQFDPIHVVLKSKFIDECTGFVTALKSNENKSRILKTTDKGHNWSTVLNISPYDFYTTFDIIGSNLHVYHQMKVYRSTDAGQNWYAIYFDMSAIVGSAPSEQIVLKFLNTSTGYLAYVNSDNPYPTLFIFKTNNGGESWTEVYTKMGNDEAKYKFVINDFTIIGNDVNHVLFGGYMRPTNLPNLKGIMTLETYDGFNSVSFGSEYSGGEDCHCINRISSLPNSPNLIRIILSKYKYSNYFHPDNGTYCRIGTIDYKIGNNFYPDEFGGVNFSNDNTGYTFIDENIYRTTNSGINWTCIKEQLPRTNLCRFSINSIGDIVYVSGVDGYFTRKFISTSISTVKELQEGFNGNFTLNGGTYNTPFNYFIEGGYNNLSANETENKIFYKWNDGDMNNNRVIKVLYDNFNLIANYKTNGVADNENAIANPNLTKSLRDTNGTINRIHESIGGIFYSRSTDNGETFSNEQIVNNGGEADGNFNSFISEIKPHGDFNIDPVGNMVVVWQRREGNNEIIKFAYKSCTPSYSWSTFPDYYITVPSANSFNLQAKCFVQETASSSHNFFSLTAYLKPNGSNIDLMVTAKSSSSATPNNYVIESGNISEFAVTRSSQGIYQVLYFSFIKDNHVYFKCAKFFIYGSGVSYWSDPSNPDFTVSLNPDDGQILRISPDISLRNGRPIITYRGKNVFQKWIQFNGGEDYLLSLYNYPIFVRYKYENLNNQEVWSSRTVYNSVGIEQKYPNIEGCKNGYAYVLNYNYINKYRQVAYLQNGPGYCVPGQYEVKDVKLVRGSFYGSAYPYSSPKISTLTQSTQQNLLYNVGNLSFTISNLPNGNSNISDNLLGTIREQNLNYNFALGPIIAKNTNVDFPSEVETSISNPVEFSNTMVSSPFSLGPNDTLILNGYGYYNYVSGEIFTQKRFSVNLIRKSTQGLYMTLFSDSIGVVDTTECEYLRGFVFEEGIIPEVDSFYIQLVLDSTSIEQGDNYSICNVYSPDELIEQDNPNPYKSIVHFINGNNNNNIISIPIEYSLSQNFPNPFNPVTKIQFEIPKDGLVSLKVYDVLGREVKNLVNEVKSAGRYTVLLDGSDLASGVYFYRIESGDFVQVKRMILLK